MEHGNPRECSTLKMAGGVGPPKEPLSAPGAPSWRGGKRAHIYYLHASGHPCCLTGTSFFPVQDNPGSHEHLELNPFIAASHAGLLLFANFLGTLCPRPHALAPPLWEASPFCPCLTPLTQRRSPPSHCPLSPLLISFTLLIMA